MAKKFYAVIDTETCTHPRVKEAQGDNAGLNFPLVYDLAITVIDREGTIYHREEWLISETYGNVDLFNTGYYANKRPIYEKRLARGETKIETWKNASLQLLRIMERYKTIACAYNALFDFKKAFNATNRYTRALYKADHRGAVDDLIDSILSKKKYEPRSKDPTKVAEFWLVDTWFPIIDIWAFACLTVFQTKQYKAKAIEQGWFSQAGNFTTNAEICYRYISNDDNFEEEHTAMGDTLIEAEILAYLFKHNRGKIPYGLMPNPWQKVGKITKKDQV